MKKIVFLDRQSLRAELRPPSFEHAWVEHVQTHADQVVARLQGASVAITNKVPIRRETLAQLPDLKLIAMAATGYDVIDDGRQGQIRVRLKYGPRGEVLIHKIERQSKPGRRVYSGVTDLPTIANGLGVSILSTPKGVMADHDARDANVGGEILCTVF